ncbi:hypothetical protein [Rhodohalobacter sp.]|uniref:hypothetical protein n=1 Tax=Rhodohalobacter sp. TaxID=1974210 RepID=UPI002ACE8307|nr:hypothetical protein [Rhodohalobacter sp.]MDZ7757585.1 hypothetical protein [Rhodohalobacter sp.]
MKKYITVYATARYYILLILLLSAHSGFAQQVYTFVDTDSLRVGDIFEYTIVVDSRDQLLSYPTEDDFEEQVEVVDRTRYQVHANRDSLVYKLQFFGTDNLTLDRKSVQLSTASGDTTLFTNRVPIFFKTLLAEEDEEFRPLKPIFEFARSIYPYIIIFLILLISGYLIYRYIEQQKRKQDHAKPKYQPIPFENPFLQLKSEIEHLRPIDGLSTFDDFEQFYVEIGDAIRRYLKRVHKIPALEMTTSEITASLKKEFVSAEVISITRKVLNSADMVKFAHFEPTKEQARSTLDKANTFIEIVSESDAEIIDQMREKHDLAESEKSEISNAGQK